MKRSSSAFWWEDLKAAHGSIVVVLLWWGVNSWLSSLAADANALYWTFGLSREGFFSGKWWALLSYAGLHGSWIHALLNGLAMVFLGARVERIGGVKWLAGLFVFGTLAGGVLHLAFESERILVGGSGGIMAMLLFLTGVSAQARLRFLPLSGKNFGRGILLGSLFLMVTRPDLGWPVLSGMGEWIQRISFESVYAVSHACHAGGAIAGLAWARWTLRPRMSLQQIRRAREKNEQRAQR